MTRPSSLVVPFFYFGKVNPGTLAEPWFVVSHLYVLMAACKISLMRDVFSAWKPKVVEDIFQTQGRGSCCVLVWILWIHQ